MLLPEQRHRHSGLGGDGEKIRYSDLEGLPISSGIVPFIGSFTLSGTGNISITGVGFTPKLVRFIAGDNSGSTGITGIGAMTILAQYSLNNVLSSVDNTKCIHFGNPSKSVAQYVSMDADGFTINCVYWTATTYVAYECFG